MRSMYSRAIFHKLFIGQLVAGIGIQRYVEYGIFCAAIYGQIGRETLHCIREVETVGALQIDYPIASQQIGFPAVHLVGVVF